jgi:hypothetical protein
MGQFGLLDSLQRVLSRESHTLSVRIIGVNDKTQEQFNEYLPSRITLPFLQDTDYEDVWGLWHAAWRDVFVLDDSNRTVAKYNLFEHDLGDTASFHELTRIMRDAAH